MKKLIAMALAAGVSIAAAAPADAAQGCGPRAHRGFHGRCVADFRGGYGRGRGGPLVIRNHPGHGDRYDHRRPDRHGDRDR